MSPFMALAATKTASFWPTTNWDGFSLNSRPKMGLVRFFIGSPNGSEKIIVSLLR